MTPDENDYETEPMESSPPAYPPRGVADGSSRTDEPTRDDVRQDEATTDREVRRTVSGTPADVAPAEQTALFDHSSLDEFNGRWSEIQTSFVDEPRKAVEQADGLVADVIGRIGDSFEKQRSQLEGQWDSGGDVSTEDLRQAFQRYRSFFSRLLGI